MSAAESKELHLTKLKSTQQWKVETSPNNALFVASAIYIVYIIQWGPCSAGSIAKGVCLKIAYL